MARKKIMVVLQKDTYTNENGRSCPYTALLVGNWERKDGKLLFCGAWFDESGKYVGDAGQMNRDTFKKTCRVLTEI